MKVIKLRAWDDNNEEIIPWEKITIEKAEGETKLSVVVHDDFVGDYYDHFPIMQYTGLKDKGGREIYEGDIIGGKHWNSEVIFQQCGFWLSRLDSDSKVPLWEEPRNLEVIGNVHENPELLGSKI